MPHLALTASIQTILMLLAAPALLMLFGVITAYVWQFRIRRSGLGFDYAVFTIIVLLAMVLGGAI